MKINDDARNNETSKNDKSLPHNNEGCVVACWLKSGDDDREPLIYIYIYLYLLLTINSRTALFAVVYLRGLEQHVCAKYIQW